MAKQLPDAEAQPFASNVDHGVDSAIRERVRRRLRSDRAVFIPIQLTFTSAAPERCAGQCMRLGWVDQASVGQGLLKIAVQVQNIPARGISTVSNILIGKSSGTFSEATTSFVFNTWNAGDFFERLGKPVRYEASDLGTVLSNCCLTSYAAGFPTPAPTDRVTGDGTIVVLVYRLRQAGTVELDPGLGLLGDIFATSYTALIRVTGS